jgi:diguanylate cyclase (GGDEF)-like protein
MTPGLAVLLRALPVAALAVYPLAADNEPLRHTLLITLALACLAAAAAGVVLYRPVSRGVWMTLLGGVGLFVLGDLLAGLDAALGGTAASPSAADLARLAAFPVLAAGLLRLAGRRHPDRERGALLDAALVGCGAATVAGIFLILPTAEDESLSLPARIVAIAYPAAAVLILTVLTRLVTTRGARTPAFYLLAASAVAIVVSNAGTALLPRGTPGHRSALLELLWQAGYVLFAFAALHPSMATLSASTRDGRDRLTAARLGALGAAMAITPVTLTIQAATGGIRSVPLTVVGSIGVTVLVLLRILGLLRQVENQSVQLAAIARSDALTGLPNRRSWDYELDRACTAARERDVLLVVGLMDLDHFKMFNDAHGHQAGDELLRSAAAAWHEALGDSGTLARYGGEEFALAMLVTEPAEAVVVLERLRAVTPCGQTFSAGAALWDLREAPVAVVARADAALYAAKDAGRDRIVLAPDLSAQASAAN